MIALLWHVYHKGHSIRVNRDISVPGLYDQYAKGWLYVCECGKTMAR